MYPWLDRAPKGGNEDDGPWWRRKDEYDPGQKMSGWCCRAAKAQA